MTKIERKNNMNKLSDVKVSFEDVLALFKSTEQEKDIYIQDAVTLFMNFKRLHNRPGTVEYYTSNLKIIQEYLVFKGIHTVRGITKQTLTDIVLYLRGRGNKNVSINKRIMILLSLIHWCNDEELITPHYLKFHYLEEEPAKIETVNMKDMQKVITYLPNLSARHQAMILLLFTTGIRTNELCNIETENVDLTHLTIYLKFTKTKTARYTAIMPEVAPILQEVIQNNNGSKYLFPEKESHITPVCVKSLLRRIKKALNIDVLSAHKLRHLYATTQLRQGTDIKSVSKLLGHKSIRMTERYLDLTDTEIFEKGRMNNPLKQVRF